MEVCSKGKDAWKFMFYLPILVFFSLYSSTLHALSLCGGWASALDAVSRKNMTRKRVQATVTPRLYGTAWLWKADERSVSSLVTQRPADYKGR